MITDKYLLEKYSTRHPYISPVSEHCSSDKIPTRFWCKATPEQLLADYVTHAIDIPSKKCEYCKISLSDGVLRDFGLSLTDEEKQWLLIEFKLRNALVYGKAIANFVVAKTE
jgi:hypothetical protein